MNNTTFTKNVVEPTIEQIQTLLVQKGAEYTREDDRFHVFINAGAMKGETPEQALWGMNAKHIISIQDIVNDTAKGIVPPKKLIDEKINDNINMLMLLKGMLYARVDKLNEAVMDFNNG